MFEDFKRILKVFLQIFSGLAFIIAGIYAAIYLWPVSEAFAIIAGVAGVGIGFIIWFPSSAKLIIEEMFDSI